MPRGVKNVQKVDEDAKVVEETTATEMVSANEDTKAEANEESKPVEAANDEEVVDDFEAEESVAPAAEGETEESEKKEVVKPDHKIEMLRGTFKIYRGRNIATITSLAAVVIPAGEVIEEDGIKWLPVIFTSRTGKQAAGFIITQ